MNTILLLCGMGSSGKSTLSSELIKYIPRAINISVDNIMHMYRDMNIDVSDTRAVPSAVQDYKYLLHKFTQCDNCTFILDFSHDCMTFRKQVLDCLNNKGRTNMIAISVRPPFEEMINRIQKRYVITLSQEDINTIKSTYDAYEYPQESEFSEFNSYKHLIIEDSSVDSINKVISACNLQRERKSI